MIFSNNIGFKDVRGKSKQDFGPALVSSYPMTETTGDMIDIIAGNNGSVFGSMIRSGTDYEFNGSNTYVSIPDNDEQSFVDGGDVPFTIELDIKFKSFADGWIISRRTSGSTAQEYQLICFSNTIALYLFQGGDDVSQIGRSFPTSELTLNTYYKLKANYDGSLNRTGIQLLIDDVRKDTTDIGSASYTGMANTTANTHVGNYAPGLFYFNGFMKNIKIYKGASV